MQINIESKTYQVAETIAKAQGISVEELVAILIREYARKILKLES